VPFRSIRRLVERRLNPERVLFYHIAKCGGMSVIYALAQAYRPWRLVSHQSIFQLAETPTRLAEGETRPPGLSFRQEALLYALANPAVRLAMGHFELSPRALGDVGEGWRFVTVLRDPADRWFSHYYYNFGRHEKYGIHEPLEAFVETPYAREMGRLYVRHFSCRFDLAPEDEAAATAEAIAAVGRFDVVGRTSDMAAFAEALKQRTGLACAFGRDNVGRTRKGSASVAPEIVERVRTLCAPDYAVYEAAIAAPR
jgi:hypothetical protein